MKERRLSLMDRARHWFMTHSPPWWTTTFLAVVALVLAGLSIAMLVM